MSVSLAPSVNKNVLLCNEPFMITSFQANGVVTLHTIPFFSPSIYVGHSQPLCTNHKLIHYRSLEFPTASTSPLPSNCGFLLAPIFLEQERPHPSTLVEFQHLGPGGPNSA
ncbi:hypothetical protein AVEN_219092-1 [Araneus ventricosus]|uniref:Uncharacterized protein n=1 Tax=Araneus ventricosus TaxID=182803 RepID=A0A4Y2MAB9_ARAVE|nr:hypothetical protein AVEN_219092-1 [Araneus ventricosus]